MADFATSSEIGTLSGHSIGIEGDFVSSHDYSTCADKDCPLCCGDTETTKVEFRANEGGLTVQSSDFLGIVWETSTINYSFDGSSYGYESFNSTYQLEFETAMATWSDVSDIAFAETSTADADWLIVWDATSDGSGGVLGTAYYVDQDGDGIMEQGPDYVLIVMDPADTEYFLTTAIHEAGHGLGLDHVDHTTSIMSTYLDTSLSTITSYDIELIQSLYGASGTTITETAATVGTEGTDSLFGSSADEVISGAGGSDTISGAAGDDILYGNKQTDLLIGGSGDDTIFGGQNNGPESGDPLALREGADTISGGDGNDILYGNHGGDYINGDAGADTIFGGQDADTIHAGAGYDDLYGNLGADRFLYTASAEGWDYIYNYAAEDAIQLSGGVSVTSINVDLFGDTVITLSSGTRIDLIGYTDTSSVTFEVV